VIAALALLGALAAPAPAAERPTLTRFHCEIGSNRIHILIPRAAEERTDDELLCQVRLGGLSPRGQAELAAEVRAQAPDGRVLTVASGTFDRDENQARIDELVIPHATWVSAVRWGPGSAVLRLTLHVLARAPGAKHWRPVLSRALVIDHHPRRRSR
jgi:hypothetical protein